MAEAQADKTISLSEQYLLEEKEEKPDVVETPGNAASEVVALEKDEGTAAADSASEESDEPTPTAAGGESTEANSDDAENSGEAEETSKDTENAGDEEEAEETQEIKLETAPADFRFPTTNQTRHCFTRYVEYHRCITAKGEDAPECDKFAKFYRALCPGEWVERWNEQRENGTFPGPL
ncbi:hypothetical protein FNV43_RR11090 [Rhamnella rubrinervis]|uniref:Cytochrome c oxidase subunit 6b-1 n=1 Tax=Rhamnella rubrinervis TaxID=2594499 RepID=A0A8K0MHJ1_9ROSA|nr:hypothetical protein FNV43_RR11090 [Rhamnella rubrinervis]